MVPNWRASAEHLRRQLVREKLYEQAVMVLIGSAARGATWERSDVDFLVVLNDERSARLRPEWDRHVHIESRRSFLDKLHRGDDLPSWALRLGIPLRDPDGWWLEQVQRERLHPRWPDWTLKFAHARKRLSMATRLLELEDTDAAAEELLFAASHLARAVLLREGRFPLSRPELAGQLQDLDPPLAATLRDLLLGGNLTALRAARTVLAARLDALESEQLARSAR